MKKIKYALLLLLAILAIDSYCNIAIIGRKKPLKTCVIIDNVDDYPDITVFGLKHCIIIKSNAIEVINSFSNVELNKACPVTFYAVKKSYLEKKPLAEINWKKDKNIVKSITVKAQDYIINQWNIETIEIHFKIAGFDKNTMVMYKSSQVIIYSDDKDNSVENYDYKGDLSKLRKTY